MPLITVVADVVGNLINGHYRHQQHMAELENEYRLEKARIEQETVINCKKMWQQMRELGQLIQGKSFDFSAVMLSDLDN